MAIPDFQSVMLPLLKFSSDQAEHSLQDAVEFLAGQFELTIEERQELLPSGKQARFDNRVAWARSYFKQAGLVENTRRGFFKISQNPVPDKKGIRRGFHLHGVLFDGHIPKEIGLCTGCQN